MKSGLEIFENGELISTTYWNEDGSPASEDTESMMMPRFPGGDEALMRFLGTNIKYPKEDIDNGTSGIVYVQFTIDEKGNLINSKVLRSVSPTLDAESLRVVRTLPNWIPGKMHNRKVSIQYNLPIKFSLQTGKMKKKKS